MNLQKEKAKDEPLKKYRLQYAVEGIRTFLPLFTDCEGRTVEEAASSAVTKLTKEWTKKIGGKVKTITQAKIFVFFDPNMDKVPEFAPDYQI